MILLFFTMMAATIQPPHGFFLLSLCHGHTQYPRHYQYKTYSIHLRFTLKVSPRIQGSTLKVLSKAQGFPRFKVLPSRSIQGYKVILTQGSIETILLRYSLPSSRSIVPSCCNLSRYFPSLPRLDFDSTLATLYSLDRS